MKQSTKYLKILCNMIAAILILVFVICIVPRLISYFMPFVVGFLLALIANPVVKFLEKKIKIKRKYGTVIMIVGVIAVIVLICYGNGFAWIYGLSSDDVFQRGNRTYGGRHAVAEHS